MDNFPSSPRSRLLVVGYGAAGQPIANGLAKAGADVTAVDGAEAGQEGSTVQVLAALPSDLSPYDLIITVVTASVTEGLARDLAARNGSAPVLDLSSSTAAGMRKVEAILGDRLVDGVILGAVALGKHRTPLLLAGGPSKRVAALLEPYGCRITVLDNAVPGDAGDLKLLRSIFTKGVEALVVELYTAASAMNQVDQLSQVLADLDEGSFREKMLDMLRTHPRHAERRYQELTAAYEAVKNHDLPAPMTEAALAVFDRTSQAGQGPDQTAQEALEWLVNEL